MLAAKKRALADLPHFIRAIRGRIGDLVYKTYGRKIIVTRAPCFDGYVPSPAQQARRDRLKQATAYAQRVYANPTAKALYVAAARRLGRQPFRLAVFDYLSAPSVKAIDLSRYGRMPSRVAADVRRLVRRARFTGPPAFRPFRSTGHPAFRPSGLPVDRSTGPPVHWSTAHPVIRPSDHPAIRSTGRLVNRSTGPPAFRPSGPPVYRPAPI